MLDAYGDQKELRGNDLWMCLPDGADRDAEPTGFIFDASGETAYVNIQHRATGRGAMLKITGFKLKKDGWAGGTEALN